jgi:hypothetical protein
VEEKECLNGDGKENKELNESSRPSYNFHLDGRKRWNWHLG